MVTLKVVGLGSGSSGCYAFAVASGTLQKLGESLTLAVC